jgi:phage terminase large subunit-like protein
MPSPSYILPERERVTGDGLIIPPQMRATEPVYIPPAPAPSAPVYVPPDTKESILQQIQLQERINKMTYGLPHLNGWKFYRWAREFFESRNKMNFLCAANQISKSSTQIRKSIHWATEKSLWPQLWERPPSQFWYLYPSQEVVNMEFKLKWVREFLPRGEFKDDPVYGWEEIKERGDTLGIRFNSGVYIFFRTYTKNVQNLQTGTVDAIFCDEELPEHLYNELTNRLNATNGYFHMVFTATLGQEIWRLTMEATDDEKRQGKEMFPEAAKWSVSLYECQQYEDGTASHWTPAKIAMVRSKCSTQKEVMKRVMGRFVRLSGLKYPNYDATKHMKAPHPIPSDWLIYEGVDIGSGGDEGHPSAIVFIAVHPNYRQARVFLGWRGDGEITTAGDVFVKHTELKTVNKITPLRKAYDWASADFGNLAERGHDAFEKANKSKDMGDALINTLFKFDMLAIYETEELSKLGAELSCLLMGTDKKHAKDDFADALRYALSLIPFDFTGLVGLDSDFQVETPEKPMTPMEKQIAERRQAFIEGKDEESVRIEDEFAEWNDAYG